MLPGAVRFHQTHEERGEVAEGLDFLLVGVERLLEQVEGNLRRGVGFGQPGANTGATLLGQRAADGVREDLPRLPRQARVSEAATPRE